MDTNKRWVYLSYLALSLAAWFVAARLIGAVIYLFRPETVRMFGVVPVESVAGLAIGGGLFAWLYRAELPNRFFMEVIKELRKVSWPTFKETRAATIVVLIFVLILSLILGMFDLVWSWVTDLFYVTG